MRFFGFLEWLVGGEMIGLVGCVGEGVSHASRSAFSRQVEMTGGLIQPIGFVLMMGLIVVLGWDGMVFKGCS